MLPFNIGLFEKTDYLIFNKTVKTHWKEKLLKNSLYSSLFALIYDYILTLAVNLLHWNGNYAMLIYTKLFEFKPPKLPYGICLYLSVVWSIGLSEQVIFSL